MGLRMINAMNANKETLYGKDPAWIVVQILASLITDLMSIVLRKILACLALTSIILLTSSNAQLNLTL